MQSHTALRSAIALSAIFACSTVAQAQLFRAYLDPSGNDANPCTLPAPCRLIPAALAAVADGGEIWLLDSANYNTATVIIGKSVTILAVPGAIGSVVATGGPAISIAPASLNVALRNLVIAPLPAAGGTDGVNMTGASMLTIEGSLIANLPGNGAYVTGTGKLKIANTTLRNNGGHAVRLEEGAQAVISGSQMHGNVAGGVYARAQIAPSNTTASVSDSVISGGAVGVHAHSFVLSAFTKIFVTRSTIEGATTGLRSECPASGLATAIVTVAGSTIVNNGTSHTLGGTGTLIRTMGNNQITDNFGVGGSLTPTALQ